MTGPLEFHRCTSAWCEGFWARGPAQCAAASGRVSRLCQQGEQHGAASHRRRARRQARPQ